MMIWSNQSKRDKSAASGSSVTNNTAAHQQNLRGESDAMCSALFVLGAQIPSRRKQIASWLRYVTSYA